MLMGSDALWSSRLGAVLSNIVGSRQSSQRENSRFVYEYGKHSNDFPLAISVSTETNRCRRGPRHWAGSVPIFRAADAGGAARCIGEWMMMRGCICHPSPCSWQHQHHCSPWTGRRRSGRRTRACHSLARAVAVALFNLASRGRFISSYGHQRQQNATLPSGCATRQKLL